MSAQKLRLSPSAMTSRSPNRTIRCLDVSSLEIHAISVESHHAWANDRQPSALAKRAGALAINLVDAKDIRFSSVFIPAKAFDEWSCHDIIPAVLGVSAISRSLSDGEYARTGAAANSDPLASSDPNDRRDDGGQG